MDMGVTCILINEVTGVDKVIQEEAIERKARRKVTRISKCSRDRQRRQSQQRRQGWSERLNECQKHWDQESQGRRDLSRRQGSKQDRN